MIQYLKKSFNVQTTIALLKNLALLLGLFMLTRIVFTVMNLKLFANLGDNTWLQVFRGALMYDIAAIVYVNMLYIVLVMMPLPSHWRVNRVFVSIQRWIFTLTNGIALLANLVDTVYFPYTQRRTTMAVFDEFANEHNLTSIFVHSMLQYWYLTLLAVLIFVVLYKCFSTPDKKETVHRNNIVYWFSALILLIVVCAAGVIGIRGGIGTAVRPIAMTNATQYVQKPFEASIVLNTPFSIIRSSSNNKMPEYKYFTTDADAELRFPTLHTPVAKAPMKRLNVVVIIMESFSKGYIGSMNKTIIGKNYKGYTPFLDSLISQSLTFENSIANGHKSIDALPSVLASVPSFVESYFKSDYGNDDVSSLAADLKPKGYHSAFFHGAPNGSLGLWAFAKASGFQEYYGKDEYNNDADFDGTWAIWDEPFLQFYANKMSSFKEPFVTAFFSATSHNPFVIPDKYKSKYKEESLPIYKCIRYSDNALRAFFATARKTKWFKNTLFVITGDHTNMMDMPGYNTNIGLKSVPVIFYYPAGIKPEIRKEIVQQIDIKPSVLGYLGYDKSYIAFGRDVFNTSVKDSYAVYENNYVYEYMTKDFLLQFDGQKATSLYKYNEDRACNNNLIKMHKIMADSMELRMKAMLQLYQSRLKNNMLIVR